MELWIRSQNKGALIKVEMLGNTDGIIHSYSGVNKTVLGKYKSDERALEILDEIQNILMPKCIINSKSMKFSEPYEKNGIVLMDCNADARWEQLNTYVYEMPKE